MSALNQLGHQCEDELLEQSFHCRTCKIGPIEYQWNDKDWKSFGCPKCNQEFMSIEKVKAWREKQRALIEDSEIVVFQRPTSRAAIELIRLAKSLGKKTVQTADDLYFRIPAWNTGANYYNSKKDIIESTFREVDAVDVTMPYLKTVYSELNPHVEVLPNSLDIELLEVQAPLDQYIVLDGYGKKMTPEQFQAARQGKTLMLWGGSPTHEKDLELIINPLRRLTRSENVAFAFVGFVHRALTDVIPKDRLFLFSLVPASAYYSLYKAIAPEIGLAPVVDVEFNWGKSPLKVLEYAALGILPIASDVVTYQGAIEGALLTQNTDLDWTTQLKQAVHMDQSQRADRIEKNRNECSARFDIKKNAVLWERFYQQVLER